MNVYQMHDSTFKLEKTYGHCNYICVRALRSMGNSFNNVELRESNDLAMRLTFFVCFGASVAVVVIYCC